MSKLLQSVLTDASTRETDTALKVALATSNREFTYWADSANS